MATEIDRGALIIAPQSQTKPMLSDKQLVVKKDATIIGYPDASVASDIVAILDAINEYRRRETAVESPLSP